MRFVPALLVLMSLSIPVHADWDAAGEAREAAAAKAEADRQAAVNKKNTAAAARETLQKEGIDTTGKSDDAVIEMMDARMRQNKAAVDQAQAKSISDMRKTLGTAADGKSDEEVMAMYAARAQQQAEHYQQQIEANRDQTDAQLQSVTGKTMQEMQNMSDEELDKMADDLEKKYGQ